MRSLRYILDHHPRTFDDCLDMACKQPPDRVTFSLMADELVSGDGAICQFVGIYRWEFKDEIRCTVIHNSMPLPTTEQQKAASIAIANSKLCYCLGKIQQFNIV